MSTRGRPANGAYSQQISMDDWIAMQQQDSWAAQSPRRMQSELRPGDIVEVRREGRPTWSGWCATQHPADHSWEIEVPGAPWESAAYSARYRTLPSNAKEWRYVRHDPEWRLIPDPEALKAWVLELGAHWPLEGFPDLFHRARSAWPIGVPDNWYAVIKETFTELAIQRMPVPWYLKASRKLSNAGKRIWCCPMPIQKLIAEDIWSLPGVDRMSALFALRWTRADEFGCDVSSPEAIIAMNRHTASIYEGYLTWAIENATTSRQLLELCDDWGSNPVREERENPHPFSADYDRENEEKGAADV